MKRSQLLLFFLCLTGTYLHAQQCDYQADYSSNTGWTQVGTEVSINNGAVEFDEAEGGQQRRVYQSLPSVLNDNDTWQIDFEFTPTALGQWSNNTPAAGHFLLALTAGTQDPVNDCPNLACSGYPNGTQDGIMVNLITPAPGDGSVNFRIMHRDGGTETVSGYLPFIGLNTTHYLTFERLGPNDYELSVYADPARSTPIAGSPLPLNVPTAITGLNTIQHGTIAQGNPVRELSGTIDDVCLDVDPQVVIPQDLPAMPFGKIILLSGLLLTLGTILIKRGS